MFNAKVITATLLVFLGCCSNVVFLELIIKEDPGAGNIITFCQFFFIFIEGLVFVTNFLTIQPIIPIRKYLTMVSFYFFVSVVNNYALNFDIPMPLHMIFRAGSLVANMIMGILIRNKKYAITKYVAVMMIFLGISMATIASANNKKSELEVDSNGDSSYFTLSIGIILLSSALFGSARMGVFQEVLYEEYGKHPREAMFYTHSIPLPGFLLLAPSLWSRVISFTASEPIYLPMGLAIPKLWLYILGNCLTQYVCIRGVFTLTTECPSLVVTLIITLRKFVSLLFSIFYFQNPFTTLHWIATALVFSGTGLFSGIFSPVFDRLLALFKSEPATKDKHE